MLQRIKSCELFYIILGKKFLKLSDKIHFTKSIKTIQTHRQII